MKVCISNAGSPVSYHLLNSIASGEIFGTEQELVVNLLGNDDELAQLNGMQMEVMDLAHNVLRGVTVTSDPKEAFAACEAVIMLNQLMREDGEPEDIWLKRNIDNFVNCIAVMDELCKPTVKVLIAGIGPINTSLYVVLQHIKNIDKKNIITMPRLIENQAKAIIAQKVHVKTSDVVDVITWGDNQHYFCDLDKARVHNHDGPIWGPPSYSRLANILVSL